MTVRRARPRGVVVAGLLLGVGGVAACSTSPTDDRGLRSAPSEIPGGATSAPAPSDAPAPSRPRAVTIALAGDVHFEGVLRARLDDPASALAPATEALAAADVAVVNLETSVGTGGAPAPGKRFAFQAPPSALAALAAAGVDVASQANNHALDLGPDPLPAALRAMRRSPVAVVGLGRDAAEAFAPAVLDVGGTEVAVLGATVADLDPTADPTGQWAATASTPGTADAVDPARLLRAVRQADRDADVVVAYLHWGVQGEGCPSPDQRSLARSLVEAGADVVAGTHAHRLQGDGRLGEGYVAYGLGNFAWYTQGSAESSTTGTLTLRVRPAAAGGDGRARVVDGDWQPARIGPDGLPRPLPPSEVAAFDAELAVLRACAGLRRPVA